MKYLIIGIYIYFIVAWIINLVQFFQCDFAEPYKEEVIKAIGIFLVPIAGITVWF